MAQAQSAGIHLPVRLPQGYVALPGSPFGIATTSGAQWVFVAMTGNGASGIAVLQRTSTSIQLVRTVPLAQSPTGIVITHDGRLLIAAAGNEVYFLDTGSLISGGSQALVGSISDGAGAGSIDANVTADDHWLFVADEDLDQITVIDLDRARAAGYQSNAVVGAIPAGAAPTQVSFSEDGQWLYSTSEVALPSWGWTAACIQERPCSERGGPKNSPCGAIR